MDAQKLQEEVEAQQGQVFGLHNMVVVVDETNSEEGWTTQPSMIHMFTASASRR